MIELPLPVLPRGHPEVVRLLLAVALGAFLGLEREWSQKSAGVRTFALITLAGAVFTLLESEPLLLVGGALVVVQGAFLGLRGLVREDRGLALTTSTSMLVAYGVGVLVAAGHVIEGVVVALLSSMLLVLKRELHEFARDLSKEEVRSASELAILAFVIYPLLPTDPIDPWGAIDPRAVWLLVIAMSAIGFVNYVLIQKFGSKGLGVSGFVGGLVNSAAVVGEIASRSREHDEFGRLAIGGILLAQSALAFRNMLIVVIFLPELAALIAVPLAAMSVAGVALSVRMSDWNIEFETNLESPFSLRNALQFGALFLVVLVVSAAAEATFGSAGFVVTGAIAGLVSSGSVVTTAVVLVGSGQITHAAAAAGVVVATVASILVKIVLAASLDRSIVRPVATGSLTLVVVGAVTMLAVTSLV